MGFILYAGIILYVVLKRVTFKGFMTPESSSSVDERVDGLLGHQGQTVTPLRPAGMALINGKKVDVVSVGDFIERDCVVEVVEISGNRVVVRENPD